MNATARNAPCPCGSGKRYKNCHGAFDADSETAPKPVAMPHESDAREWLERGLALQQRGDAAQAQRYYERVLELDPDHPDAWHLLALLDLADRRPQAALEKVSKAIATFPEHPHYHLSLARALLALDRAAEAATAAHAAIDRDARQIDAWCVLGSALAGSDFAAAVEAWRRAIALDRRAAEPHFLLGNAFSAAGDYEAARETYLAGLETSPDSAQMLNNLALAHEKLGRPAEAEPCYRQAIALQPGFGEAHANLGNLLFAQKRRREAIACYRSATALGLDHAEIWANLGIAYQNDRELDEALHCFERAATLRPASADLRCNVGSILVELGRSEHARACYAAALAIDPDHAEAENQLLFASLMACRWDGLTRLIDSQLSRLRSSHTPPMTPFTFLALPSTPADQLRAARVSVHSKFGVDAVPRPQLTRKRGERLRIGYLSSDLGQHALAALITELLERHDRSRCEVFAYAYGPADSSAERERIKHAVDHWQEVNADSDSHAAQRIRDDGIHILFDLNGYTQFARSEIPALRPAPIQVNWLGYLGTLGAPWYDYVVTDRFVSPPAQQTHFSERFLYLPNCYCPSDTRRTIDAQTPSRAECGLPESGFVFCCFNTTYKLLPDVWALWMRLLRDTADGVLWLAPGDPAASDNLRATALALGVDPARLIFAPRVAPQSYLARLRCADLFLDTFPYNAGVTCNDALLVGLPVLTCAGETYASRIAGSQLHAIGLPELVTHSLADYEATALRLAREPGLLTGLRMRLGANRHTHCLFDMAQFTREFEDALELAWEQLATGVTAR